MDRALEPGIAGPKARDPDGHFINVYDGQRRRGMVADLGPGKVFAFDEQGRPLGLSLEDRRTAVAAVLAAAERTESEEVR